MSIDYQYSYLVLTIPFVILWILLFVFSKNTRREQLLMSILVAPLGTVSEAAFYLSDYWAPPSILSTEPGALPYIEDFIFSFCIGGIGGVIYEAIFRKKLFRAKGFTIHKKVGLPLIGIATAILSYVLFQMGINSIFATSIAMVFAASLILSQRRDLLANSLLSGVGVMLVMFVSYLILYNLLADAEKLVAQGWLLYGSRFDIRVLNIPLTELVWGFSWGMLAGPVYEFWKNLRVS